MRKDSYESILRAVGRVLDYAGAHGFDARASEDGLHVQTFDAEGQLEHTFKLELPDLVELLDWSAAGNEMTQFPRSISSDDGTLAHFLSQHSRELVGTFR